MEAAAYIQVHTSFEDAQAMAERAGLMLNRSDAGLVLSGDGMDLRADFTHMKKRVKAPNVQRELLVRAAKVKHADGCLLAVDATAGLGEDSLLLAASGFSVLMYERNPVMATMLADAIMRAACDPDLADAVARMELFEGDSVEVLCALRERPDVVLLDPMFPAKQKSSAVKKKLQLLQKLETPCDDEFALLDAALSAGARKVVVKRPAKGPHLAGRAPSYAISGKAVRYDCYVCSR